MGYRRKRKTITVRFEGDHELAGLEVVTRGLSLGTWLELVGIGEVDRSSIAEALKELSQALLSWNLEEEDGTPVPATAEAVLAEDQDTMLKVASAWLDALTGRPSGPLESSSQGGEPSLEVSIPMELPSESPVS